ncbi:MAG: efflux RND transporter permease subunit, partial [Bacteroidetes bacterium]
MDKIILFSIKNKLIVLVFIFALIFWGMYAISQIPIDAVPDITNNQVQVITKSPSFSAQEIEQFITAPLELNLANLQQVEEIRSVSRFGLSVITVVFEDNMDTYKARQLVSEKILNVPIPKEMGTPEMMPISTGLGEIYQYIIHTKKGFEKKYSATELRTVQDWIVRRQLAGTKGVAEINSFGGFVKQYEVCLNPEKLKSFGLSIAEVFTALQTNNQNTGGSYIEKNSQAFFIRGEGMVTNLEDIKKIVIKNINQTPILVRDVAEVVFGHASRYGAMSYNGKGEVVGGIVMMLKGENSSKVIQNIRKRIEQIQKTLPEGLIIEPFLDRMDLVSRAMQTVLTNLLEGGLIVIFVLVLFLGNLRAGLVVASVIPLSLLFALGMMHTFGISANLMSLGAIDFGLVVDGAVIILEAVLHRLYLSQYQEETLEESVYQSAKQIRQSAAFGELIILMVYLPILTLSGIEGKMFKPMAQTVGFAILGALILSLTYVPMMSAWVLTRTRTHKATFADKLMQWIEKIYLPIFYFCMRFKKIVIFSTLLLFLLSITLFSFLGGEFIPQLDEGDFAVETRLSAGTSLSQTIETSQKAEKILLTFPEVKNVVSKIGTSEIPTDPMPMEANDLMVILKDKSEWKTTQDKEELANKMREALSVLIGVNFEFQQPIEMRFNELMTGARQDVVVKLFGENLDTLAHYAAILGKLAANTKGAINVYVEPLNGLPQLAIKFNRSLLAQYHISIADANAVVNASLAGKIVGAVYEDEKRYDAVVRVAKTA